MEPGLHPGCDVDVGGEVGLHVVQEVIDCCVAPSESVEVALETALETGLSQHEDELFDQGCTFGVGNSVEVVEGDIGVGDWSSDGMSPVISFIFLVAPGFPVSEVHVRRFKGGDEGIIDFVKDEMRNKVGKTLVEPEIVPPIHGDEIAEPVMRQLMHEGICKIIVVVLCRVGLKHFFLVVGDKSGIFHGPVGVISNPDLIVFFEGEGHAEEILEKRHRFLCDIEDEI